jgi:alpha-D-xyloside xylohydrolase
LKEKHCVTGNNETRLELEGGVLVLRPLAENAVRVRFTGRAHNQAEMPSLILTAKRAAPRFTVRKDSLALRLATSALSVIVDRETGAVRFEDARGTLLLREKPGTRVCHSYSFKGEPAYDVGLAFESPADERLYGSGQFQDGYLNVRDLPRRLTQVNTQISIPFLYSS